MDYIDIAGIVWIAVNYIVLCPMMLFFLYLFYQIDPSHPMMKYRNKMLVCVLNAMMFITLLFERLYANFVCVWHFTNMEPDWVFYLVFSICWWTPLFLFCVKVFDLYYKQQYAFAVQDMAWKTAINCQIAHDNWFILNRRTYGNILFCVKISLVCAVIACVINTVMSYIFGEGLVLDFTQFFVASIPVIFSFIICLKSRKIKDIYQIRNEIIYQCVSIIVALVLYLSTFLYYKYNTHISDTKSIRMEWLLRNLVAELSAIGLALIPTIYPLYLVTTNNNGINGKQY